MSKQLKTSIFLLLQQSKTEQNKRGEHLFESIKYALSTLIQQQSKEPIMTEKSLNFATNKIIKFTKKIKTDDNAPMHKQRFGFKIYGSDIAALNRLTLFKENNIKLFEKVQDSCYITSELADTLKSYSGGYTHTYKLTEAGKAFHFLSIETLTNFNKNKKVKELLCLKQIKSKDLEGVQTFKVKYNIFKSFHSIYYNCFILGNGTKEIQNKIKSSSLIFNNIIGYKDGYVYIHNRVLNKTEQDREYTVYTCLSKVLRNYIHPNNMEIDIDSACISMNLNILNDIMRQAKCQYITIKRKTGDKHIKRHYNEKDTLAEFPILSSYMKNKYDGRMNIKSAVGLNNINEAKQFVTSMNFASNKYNLEFNPTARKQTLIYTKLLMKEVHKLQKFIYLFVFKTDYQFTIMGKPVQQIRDQIDSSIAAHKELNPKAHVRGRKLSGKRMARLYFNLEKDIRETITEYLEEQEIFDSLQIHDCLVFDKKDKNKLEKHKLERYIFKKHGYKLTLSSSEETNCLTKE